MNDPGRLYIVATPIGHLQDLSLRAIATLRTVDVIACEDTRHTGVLLRHHAIAKPLVSYHDHNEVQRSVELIARLQGGESVALVSDAGTPLIEDPGYRLVQRAIEVGMPVTVIPGPSAIEPALILAGLPVHRFAFEGYLPAKPGQRRQRLEMLRGETRTVLCFETPHRLVKSLREILDVLGDVPMAAARELTKQFEEVRRGRASEVLRHFEAHPPKGEFVLIFRPTSPANGGTSAERAPQGESKHG